MSDKIKELQQDIAEYQKLMLQAQRPNVQNHLAQYVSKLTSELQNLRLIKSQPVPLKQVPTVAVVNAEVDKTKFTPLTKYAWDQEGTKVKIIFSLEGVGEECTKEQVEVLFDGWSVQLRLKGYKGTNYIFAIKKLCGEIVAGESKFVLKKNSLTIVLVKREGKSWGQLAWKEEKFGKEDKKEEEKDPSANIMGMMKKMYEDGDENTKRTIAEAWTKANDKKGEQHDFSNRYDWLKKE